MVLRKNVNTVLASAVAMTMAGGIGAAHAMMGADQEKCYGVVKAGANDCGNAAKTHSCAGHAKIDAHGGEWLGLPKGTCEKLAGGSLTPKETLADDAAEVAHDAKEGAKNMMDKAKDAVSGDKQ